MTADLGCLFCLETRRGRQKDHSIITAEYPIYIFYIWVITAIQQDKEKRPLQAFVCILLWTKTLRSGNNIRKEYNELHLTNENIRFALMNQN